MLFFSVGIIRLGVVCAMLHLDRAAYRFAGITLAIVVLGSRVGPIRRLAVHRFIEVSLGILIGLVMSAIWPAREQSPTLGAKRSGRELLAEHEPVGYSAVMVLCWARGLASVPLACMLCPIAGQLGFAQTSARCALTGKVVSSVTGIGIVHALVSYNGPAAGYRFTDAAGGFRADNVPVGQYVLTASKPGFVSEQELSAKQNVFALMGRQQDPASEALQGFQLTPSQTFQALQLKPDSEPPLIKLVPVAAISGTVLDENSEPLEGVSVQVIAIRTSLTGVEYATVQTANTDERGRYLFLKLVPGDYIIRLAGEVSTTQYYSGRLNPNNDHRGLRPVYYPSGDSTAGAFVFRLAPGEQTNADFQQATEAAFDINGQLSGFMPGAWTQMQLYRDGDRLPVARAFVNVSTGHFRVTDVPPGSYMLRVVQYQSDSEKWLAAEVPLNISAEPLRNLAVELSGAANISVSLAYEAGAHPNGPLQLTLQPQHMRQNARQLFTGKATVGPDAASGGPSESSAGAAQQTASMFADVVPDQYKLTAQTFGSDYVASATLGDRDILHGEFPIGGSAPGEMRIVVRGDSATVEGVVTAKGQPATGASVCLIPSAGGTGFRCGAGDESGHYDVQGVAPGDYRIAAWYGMPTIEQLQSLGNTLTVEAGEHRTVSVEAAGSADSSVSLEGPGL